MSILSGTRVAFRLKRFTDENLSLESREARRDYFRKQIFFS